MSAHSSCELKFTITEGEVLSVRTVETVGAEDDL